MQPSWVMLPETNLTHQALLLESCGSFSYGSISELTRLVTQSLFSNTMGWEIKTVHTQAFWGVLYILQQEERYILTLGFRNCRSLSVACDRQYYSKECEAEPSCLIHGSWGAENNGGKEMCSNVSSKSTLSLTWIPSTRPSLLRIPPSPNSIGVQILHMWIFGGTGVPIHHRLVL